MVNAHILDAPPNLFDDMFAIFEANDYRCVATSRDTKTRGIRRLDTAGYDVFLGSTLVHIGIERRLGNKTISITVWPACKSFWRRDESSENLAKRLVELLIEHGADEC